MKPVRTLLNTIAVLTVFLLYAPIFLVVLTSFFSVRRGKIIWESFSFNWYAKLFSNAEIGAAVLSSIKVGVVAVTATLVLGLAMSIYTSRSRTPRWERTTISALVFLPFLLPPIITGMALLVTMKEVGIARGVNAVILGHVVFVLAIGFRTLQTRLSMLDPALVWAARDLGAGPWRCFFQVLLPQLAMPLATSAIMSLAISFDETMITLFIVGDGMTLPIRLYGMMRYGFTPEISALVTLVLLVTAILTGALAILYRGRTASIAE